MPAFERAFVVSGENMAQEHSGRFKSKEELNGAIDPRINTDGRAAQPNKPTKRSVKDSELLSLLRKIKPHVADAVKTAVTIMGNEKGGEMTRLRAAAMVIDLHRELLDEVYAKEQPEAEPIQEGQGTVVSFKMVSTGS